MCRMGFGSILVSTGNPSVPAPFTAQIIRIDLTESLGEGAKVHTSARRLCGEISKPAVYDRLMKKQFPSASVWNLLVTFLSQTLGHQSATGLQLLRVFLHVFQRQLYAHLHLGLIKLFRGFLENRLQAFPESILPILD